MKKVKIYGYKVIKIKYICQNCDYELTTIHSSAMVANRVRRHIAKTGHTVDIIKIIRLKGSLID